jgi:hypothetical protein
MIDDTLPLDLGDGLMLRAATPADAAPLAAFNAALHANTPGETDPTVGTWVEDLLLRPHPTFRPDLFTIVEDRATGAIVSSLNLIPQTWSYGGVEFGAGRVELVGTDPGYRRRGLVRHQMAVAHRWSAAFGHLLQGITGIPWYYRQFGYEMALTLGGRRCVPVASVPTPPDGAAEPYRLRPATPDDLPFFAATDAHGRSRSLVSCVRDAALWRYELDGRSETSDARLTLTVIETSGIAGGEPPQPLGFVIHERRLLRNVLWVRACELAIGVSWLAVAPGLLRGLRAIGERYAAPYAGAGSDGGPRLEQIGLELGDRHPLYDALADRAPEGSRPYAWYIRIPDLSAFVRRIAPVLESRLATSPAAGHTGELRLNFYRDGLRLTFTEGRLTGSASWPEASYDDGDASFPPLTFLQLLLGHRSLGELRHAFADCGARPGAGVLLNALFPPAPSFVWPVA